MRIRVTRADCTGHTLCSLQAPELFLLDADGYTALDGEYEVPDERHAAARRAAAGCPERVIEIIDD